jgi:hypothetical protein
MFTRTVRRLSRLDSGTRAFAGYFIGVSSGAIAFWPIAIVTMLVSDPSALTALSPTSFSPSRLLAAIALFLVIFAVWIPTSWVIALAPFLLVRLIAKKFYIHNIAYYLFGGAASGAFICGFHEWIGWSLQAGEPGPPFVPDRLMAILGYGLGGAFGAFVFWYIAVRAPKTSPRQRPLYIAVQLTKPDEAAGGAADERDQGPGA